jgi:hypothetical protein
MDEDIYKKGKEAGFKEILETPLTPDKIKKYIMDPMFRQKNRSGD